MNKPRSTTIIHDDNLRQTQINITDTESTIAIDSWANRGIGLDEILAHIHERPNYDLIGAIVYLYDKVKIPNEMKAIIWERCAQGMNTPEIMASMNLQCEGRTLSEISLMSELFALTIEGNVREYKSRLSQQSTD